MSLCATMYQVSFRRGWGMMLGLMALIPSNSMSKYLPSGREREDLIMGAVAGAVAGSGVWGSRSDRFVGIRSRLIEALGKI